ncbi:MAG: alpha-L-fucosidase [Gammaproteobacteria bacterium]
MNLTRRESLLCLLGGAASSLAGPAIPSYLRDHEKLFQENPRAAAIEWFRRARFGLFVHYGVYSLLGRGEWVMFHENIHVEPYAQLKNQFTAAKFNADFITDLALDAGMKYVNITTRHCDGFCLFRTKETDFNSLNSPAKRDLVAELAESCRKKGLALFLYYVYGLDWRHPYFYPRSPKNLSARPDYPDLEPSYRFQRDEDFRKYIDFVHSQIRELLSYDPAGIWLDGVRGTYARSELFPLAETYAVIRSRQPYVLVSYKEGVNGDEDFVSPERAAEPRFEASRGAWAKNKGKPIEINDTLQPRLWGYNKADDGKHRSADEVMRMLESARAANANLLLNTGPLPDGSIHPEDVRSLREVGPRLRLARG